MTNSQYQSIKKKVIFLQEDLERLAADLTECSDKLFELKDGLHELLYEIESYGIEPFKAGVPQQPGT